MKNEKELETYSELKDEFFVRSNMLQKLEEKNVSGSEDNNEFNEFKRYILKDIFLCEIKIIKIYKKISKIKELKFQIILHEKYFLNKTWEEIAMFHNLSTSQMYRIRKKALEAYEEIA